MPRVIVAGMPQSLSRALPRLPGAKVGSLSCARETVPRTSKGNAWKAAIVPETRPEFPFPPEGPLNFCPEPRPSRREARGGGGLGTLMPLLASGASATCLR